MKFIKLTAALLILIFLCSCDMRISDKTEHPDTAETVAAAPEDTEAAENADAAPETSDPYMGYDMTPGIVYTVDRSYQTDSGVFENVDNYGYRMSLGTTVYRQFEYINDKNDGDLFGAFCLVKLIGIKHETRVGNDETVWTYEKGVIEIKEILSATDLVNENGSVLKKGDVLKTRGMGGSTNNGSGYNKDFIPLWYPFIEVGSEYIVFLRGKVSGGILVNDDVDVISYTLTVPLNDRTIDDGYMEYYRSKYYIERKAYNNSVEIINTYLYGKLSDPRVPEKLSLK